MTNSHSFLGRSCRLLIILFGSCQMCTSNNPLFSLYCIDCLEKPLYCHRSISGFKYIVPSSHWAWEFPYRSLTCFHTPLPKTSNAPFTLHLEPSATKLLKSYETELPLFLKRGVRPICPSMNSTSALSFPE
jgi:hypothetical protein